MSQMTREEAVKAEFGLKSELMDLEYRKMHNQSDIQVKRLKDKISKIEEVIWKNQPKIFLDFKSIDATKNNGGSMLHHSNQKVIQQQP